MKKFCDDILHFLFHLRLPFTVPEGIEVLDVHKDDTIKNACTAFYKKFYNDANQRHLLLGINPGRFGGGTTGIPFTDPIRLQNDCGIPNSFVKKQELSSVFIYDMIAAFGGVREFYSRFYISAISPLGFIKSGKNLNYYDDKILIKQIEPFVIDCIKKQIRFGLRRNVCLCIGEGRNLQYLTALNNEHKWFAGIRALSHPRFVMQYKLKQKDVYIQQYINVLSSV